MPRPEREQVHLETLEQWHDWLARHHQRPHGVWLVQWRKPTSRPRIGYEEAVEEALCWGWIDSQAGTLDEYRERLWYSPRRKGSGWSRSNKERIERLEAEGRMTEAGRSMIERARADGSWTLLDAVEALIVPDDLAEAFDAHPGSRAQWDSFPRSVKRATLLWVVSAKREETRFRRVTETARLAQQGERAHQS